MCMNLILGETKLEVQHHCAIMLTEDIGRRLAIEHCLYQKFSFSSTLLITYSQFKTVAEVLCDLTKTTLGLSKVK